MPAPAGEAAGADGAEAGASEAGTNITEQTHSAGQTEQPAAAAEPDTSPTTASTESARSLALSRVIFLDVDGVLANSRSQLVDYEDHDPTLVHDASGSVPIPLERRCIDELARVVQATGASIVLSTTWRLDGDMRRFLVNSLAPLPVIGDTPSIAGSTRGDGVDGQQRELRGRGAEITAWLRQADGPNLPIGGVQSFVILDDEHSGSFDDAGLSPFHIKTWMDKGSQGQKRDEEGLTGDKADAAIGILMQPKEGVWSSVPGTGSTRSTG